MQLGPQEVLRKIAGLKYAVDKTFKNGSLYVGNDYELPAQQMNTKYIKVDPLSFTEVTQTSSFIKVYI